MLVVPSDSECLTGLCVQHCKTGKVYARLGAGRPSNVPHSAWALLRRVEGAGE